MASTANPNIDNLPWGTDVGITDPSVSGAAPTGVTPDAGASSSVSTAAAGPDPGLTSSDPAARIDALYKQAGITDSGRGSGFADRAYWLDNPSEIMNGRLAADLAGTGTDQPTGTPGRGAWLNSGRNAPEASVGQPTRNANGGFWDPSEAVVASPTPGGSASVGAGIPWAAGASQPSAAPPGYIWDPTQARFVSLQQFLASQGGGAAGGGGGGQTPVDQTGGSLP
jgi:hypothetical protein